VSTTEDFRSGQVPVKYPCELRRCGATPEPAIASTAPSRSSPVRDPISDGSHVAVEAHSEHAAVALTPRPAITTSTPRCRTPGGDSITLNDQTACDPHGPLVVEGPFPPPPTIPGPTPITRPSAVGDPSGRTVAASEVATTRAPTPLLSDPLLNLAAAVLDDLETVRIANENRLRQLTRTETDADGEERGFGLTIDHPDVALLASLVEELGKAEHRAELNLGRLMRRHPLGPWVKSQRGVGLKQAARLLAAVGDPYWNTLHDRPRTVSELWAFTGYHVLRTGHGRSNAQPSLAGSDSTSGDPDHRVRDAHPVIVGVAVGRVRGQKSNWSDTAKKRAFVVADSCLKQLVKPCHVIKGDSGEYTHAIHVDGCACSPYRVVYDLGRAKYRDTVHPAECRRCGPAGAPAQPGSPRSAAHQHQMAIRLATKALLRDLWREAKRIHEGTG
jgi:hypothetical protein